MLILPVNLFILHLYTKFIFNLLKIDCFLFLDGPLTINCMDVSAIIRRPDTEPMSEGDLIRGVRVVKRRLPAA